MQKMQQINCKVCNAKFESKRGDAQFCSSTCRSRDRRDATDNPLKRITKVPSGPVPEGWYKSHYKNLIEELELKSISQLKEEKYFIPAWKYTMTKRPNLKGIR